MTLQLVYYAAKKIVRNFRSVVLAMIGIIVSVCVMFSIFICSNLSKKIVLELLIIKSPGISEITCRIKSDEKYQLTLNELINLEDRKSDTIEQIIFQSESQIGGKFNFYDFPASIRGIYGKPLEINMLEGDFLSSEESINTNCANVIIDCVTATTLFGSIETALYKDIDFVDDKGNIYSFCISGVYENNNDQYSHVCYISFGTYNNYLGINSPVHISSFKAVIKDYNKLSETKFYLGNFLKSRFHEEGKYDYGVMAADMTKSVDMLVNLISGILIICSLIIFIVSGISVRNVIISIMKSYRREIGIKKAMGASERIISMEYLFQGIIISLTGTILGFGIMISVITLFNNNPGFILTCINKIFDFHFGEEFSLKLYVSNVQILIIMLFSVATVIICCNGPIRESAKMNVVDSIRL